MFSCSVFLTLASLPFCKHLLVSIFSSLRSMSFFFAFMSSFFFFHFFLPGSIISPLLNLSTWLIVLCNIAFALVLDIQRSSTYEYERDLVQILAVVLINCVFTLGSYKVFRPIVCSDKATRLFLL